MYDLLIASLKDKGINAFLQEPRQLVVTPNVPYLPSFNSFWLAEFMGNWYLSTWLPAIYLIPKDKDICDVCVSVLRSSREAIYVIDETCADSLRLKRLSQDATELLLEVLFSAPHSESPGP